MNMELGAKIILNVLPISKRTECKLTEDEEFCTKHANNHEHCKTCSGTKVHGDDDTRDCLACYGIGLE